MTINYCDFTNGDDGTGDGTYGNPYKSIDTASTGLTGGDEVRVAKSNDSTDLSGTLAFVSGSTSIVTSVDLTGVLSPGDFVYKSSDSDNLAEVISLTSTVLTLYKAYYGTTETVASKKLGVTDTGESGMADQVQQILSSGSSISSRLKISGGWTLSTQVQDGFTYFRQIHSTFNNRYGFGLYASSKNYLEIEKLGFLRYYDGNNFSSFSNNVLTSIIFNNCGRNGCYGTNCDNNNLTSIICNGNVYGFFLTNASTSNNLNNFICNSNLNYGISLEINSNFNIIDTSICNNNGSYGIILSNSLNNIIDTPICNDDTSVGIYIYNKSHFNNILSPICNNSTYGIHLYTSNNNTITSPTCNNNSAYGIRSNVCVSNTINEYLGTGNISGDVWVEDGIYFIDEPILRMQHFKVTGDNRCYYEYGITYRDTVEARSSQCLKYAPTSDTYYIKQKFGFTAISGTGRNISFYIKDNVAFDGDVQAALYFMEEKITGWTTIPTTTSYVQHTLIASSTDIAEDSVLKLHIKVRGTTGNVFVDDLGIS